MSLQVVLNLTVKNFLIQVQIQDQQISGTKPVIDNIGMFYHNYDLLLTNVMNGLVYDFNYSHQDGIDLVKKYPTLQFISGMVRPSIITPYQVDGFIYGGFKWISDL